MTLEYKWKELVGKPLDWRRVKALSVLWVNSADRKPLEGGGRGGRMGEGVLSGGESKLCRHFGSTLLTS